MTLLVSFIVYVFSFSNKQNVSKTAQKKWAMRHLCPQNNRRKPQKGLKEGGNVFTDLTIFPLFCSFVF
jgi:hypothetical protein